MISSFDELWGYTSERSRRLWDEMVPSPVPRVSCRLITTYAGFEGESTLLEELYKRGLAQQEVGTDLRAGDGLLMFWSHVPIAPWRSERWLAEMRRSLRPAQYLRMIECRFVTTESIFSFVIDPPCALCYHRLALIALAASCRSRVPDIRLHIGLRSACAADSSGGSMIEGSFDTTPTGKRKRFR